MRTKYPIFLYLLALLLVGCETTKHQAKYVFLFIGDGMGVSHVTAAQLYADSVLNDTAGITFTKFPVVSSSTTYAANRFITCSAVAGTALSTGYKTSINTIGLNTSRTDTLYSIAKKFKDSGRKVAILTSVSIDHATPAAFYAHVKSRNEYYQIARQMLKSGYDFFASGGLLQPYGLKGDTLSPSIFDLGKAYGYEFTSTFSGVDSLVKLGTKPIVYSSPNPAPGSSLNYEIDRTTEGVSLADITRKAIEVVNNPNGFFIMVEGGKIDWAAHDNDAATVIHDVIAFSRAVDVAVEFYRKNPSQTLILVTADHETGGFSIGNRSNKYDVHPALLQFQKVSKEQLHQIVHEFRTSNPRATFNDLLSLLNQYTGLSGSIQLTDSEKEVLRKAYLNVYGSNNNAEEVTTYSKTDPISEYAIQIVNQKAGFGWTTGSHTGQPVPVYVIGVGQELFAPMLDNTDIPKKLLEASGLK